MNQKLGACAPGSPLCAWIGKGPTQTDLESVRPFRPPSSGNAIRASEAQIKDGFTLHGLDAIWCYLRAYGNWSEVE